MQSLPVWGAFRPLPKLIAGDPRYELNQAQRADAAFATETALGAVAVLVCRRNSLPRRSVMSSQAPVQFDDVTRELKLAEYATLREEILKKMDHRTTYRQTTLTLSLTALALGVQFKSSPLLLVVPMITILLGNLTIFQTMQVSRISAYLLENVEKPFNLQYPQAFGWHSSNQDRPRRLRESMVSSFLPNAAIPLVPSFVAIILAWGYSKDFRVTALMTAVDLLLIAYFIVVYVKNRLSL